MSVFGRILCVLPGLTHLECSPGNAFVDGSFEPVPFARRIGAVEDEPVFHTSFWTCQRTLHPETLARWLTTWWLPVAVDQHAIGTSHIERLLQSG